MNRLQVLCSAALLTGCGQSMGGTSYGALPPAASETSSLQRSAQQETHKVQHVIIIVQENRTVDNLFNGFPGADTAQSGKNSRGDTVKLAPIPLTAPYDLSHKHTAWIADYDNGDMDGFDSEPMKCRRQAKCPSPDVAAYAYVPQDEVKPYWSMGEQYAFADKMFATNEGPSFPAHQYIISGTSSIGDDSPFSALDNPKNPRGIGHQGGCNSNHDTTVPTIRVEDGSPGPKVYPCFTRTSIMQSMDAAGVTWSYYQNRSGSGLWNAVDAIKPIWESRYYRRVVWPSHELLNDIGKNNLSAVTFVMPPVQSSDHALHNNGTGPAWVASIVNAVGQSSLWDTTTIFVVWDDWGGWYDHVKPQRYNAYELGFRVPLIVIGPYVKASYVSHAQHEFGSILKFLEEQLQLKSLGTTDRRSDDFSDCFNFNQQPRPFHPISSAVRRSYFLNQPVSDEPVDDDY